MAHLKADSCGDLVRDARGDTIECTGEWEECIPLRHDGRPGRGSAPLVPYVLPDLPTHVRCPECGRVSSIVGWYCEYVDGWRATPEVEA